MKRTSQHFESHRREALITRRRFHWLNAAVLSVLVVATGLYLRERYVTHAANANLTITVHGVSSATVYAHDRTGALRGVGNCNLSSGNPPFTVSGSVTCSGTQIGLSSSDPNYPYTMVGEAISGYSGPSYAQTEGNCDAAGCIVWIPAGNSETMDLYYSTTPPPPSVSISASPTSAKVNQGFTIAWTATNNPTSCSSSGTNFASSSRPASGSQTISEPTAGNYSFSVTCSNSGGSGFNSTSVSVTPNPPTAPTSLSATGTSQSNIHLSWVQGQSNGGGVVTADNIYRDGSLFKHISAATTYDDGGFSCATSHSYTVQAIDNYGQASSLSASASGSTQACPVSTGGGGSGGGTGGGSTGGGTTGGGTGSGGSNGVPPVGGSGGGGSLNVAPGTGAVQAKDTTPPAAPANFAAVTGANGIVMLSWDPVTDESGISGYELDRSLDNVTWQTLQGSYQETSFSDVNTSFNTKYFYRLKATDGAGNPSAYVTATITTSPFQSNVSGGGATVTSDDGIVSVDIPSGAVSNDVSCAVALQQQNAINLPAGSNVLLAGPYELSCKNSAGDPVQSFIKPVTVSVRLSSNQTKIYTHYLPYLYDSGSGRWQAGKGVFDAKSSSIKFTLQKPAQFSVMGTKKTSILGYVVTLLLLLAAGAGVFIYRARSAQKAQYEDYIRRKYYNF